MPINEAIKAALEYVNQEPDNDKRVECAELLAKAQHGENEAILEIQSRFSEHLSFGTAGMRAKMQAGLNRLNRVTVAKAAFAIGSWLSSKSQPVVIGYDARLNSEIFAKEVGATLQGMGFSVHIFDACVATPICAFAVTALKAQAGIMITASHNPPQDNGIKVYGATGAQISDDDAALIEGFLKNAPAYGALPRSLDLDSPVAPDEVLLDYYEAVTKNRIDAEKPRAKLKVVYTPMHGVGFRFMQQALSSYDFVDLHVVEAQRVGDGRFPTLAFPNPEEDGALDLAISDAKKCDADLIVANDPDADRLAVALKGADGEYQMLSGNELGAILGCDVLENLACDKTKLVVTTLVSSRLLKAAAQKTGSAYAESLTGFSRVAQVARAREGQFAERFVYAFEEALGYCYGDVVRDKDGINAALHLLDRAALLKASKKTLWDELDRISLTYGLYRGMQWSFRFSGIDANDNLKTAMESLRSLKAGMTFFGSQTIDHVHDLLTENYQNFGKANIYIVVLKDHTRLVIRPSGTEPKLKFYAEKNMALSSKQALATERSRLDQELDLIKKTVSAAFSHLH